LNSKDPERLLADALRAQAVFAPQPERTAEASSAFGPKTPEPGGTDSLPPQYGLIAGAGADSLEREHAALAPLTPDPPTVRTKLAPQAIAPGLPLPVYWVLLLAVLLGLAAGSVVGLLTLL
jgi:hypothetical protein